ncbi:MAG: PHP domain-containing protein [Gemmatimonadota bacterium]
MNDAGTLHVDMHVHTRGSFDCLSDPHAVIARAVACGLDRVCITDHNAIDTAVALKDAYPGRVIVGEEVKTAERIDIIGLFLSDLIPGGTPARETCLRIREQGGLVYVPHPFAAGKGGAGVLDAIEDLVDAFEGFNARIHDSALNDRAVAWANARSVPIGAGSDAHTLREIGRGRVVVPHFGAGPAAFLAALAAGHIEGRMSPHAVHLASTWAKVRKQLPGGRFER